MPFRRTSTNPVMDQRLLARAVAAKQELERFAGDQAQARGAIEVLETMIAMLHDAASVVAKAESVTSAGEVTHCTHCRIVKFGRHRADCAVARLRAHLECKAMPVRTRSLPHR